MRITAALITVAALGFLAACGHDEVRRERTTTTITQPPPIVEQHTTTRMEKSDD